MKSYDETIHSVFDRMEVYRQTKQRQKKALQYVLTCMCVVLLLALTCVSVLQFAGAGSTPQPQQMQSPETTIAETTEPSTQSVQLSADNQIAIYPIENIPSSKDKMNICLHIDDFVAMDIPQMNAYYGINVVPEVPRDILPWEDQTHGIFKRNGGTGEVYWDSMILNYANSDFSREVNLEIDKGHLPFTDIAFFEFIEEYSVINGTKVAIGLSDSGYYYAEFLYKDVGFRLIANGISEEELVAILSSLIQ